MNDYDERAENTAWEVGRLRHMEASKLINSKDDYEKEI